MAHQGEPHPRHTTATDPGTQWSEAEARAERDAVLHLIGGDADGLRARLDQDGLTCWEWSLLAELDDLEDRLSA